MYGSSKRLHTAELLHVFRLLFLDRVDDVVDRDDAHDVIRLAHHRHDDEIVVRDNARDLFPVGARLHALHFRPGHVAQQRPFGRGEQLAQRQHTGEPALVIRRVDRVDRLALSAARDDANLAQRFFHRRARGLGDELRRHQTAGRVRIEQSQRLCLAPRLLRHLLDDLVGVLLVELLEDVGPLVRRHRAHERGRLSRGSSPRAPRREALRRDTRAGPRRDPSAAPPGTPGSARAASPRRRPRDRPDAALPSPPRSATATPRAAQ